MKKLLLVALCLVLFFGAIGNFTFEPPSGGLDKPPASSDSAPSKDGDYYLSGVYIYIFGENPLNFGTDFPAGSIFEGSISFCCEYEGRKGIVTLCDIEQTEAGKTEAYANFRSYDSGEPLSYSGLLSSFEGDIDYRALDFGSTPQKCSEFFYHWLEAALPFESFCILSEGYYPGLFDGFFAFEPPFSNMPIDTPIDTEMTFTSKVFVPEGIYQDTYMPAYYGEHNFKIRSYMVDSSGDLYFYFVSAPSEIAAYYGSDEGWFPVYRNGEWCDELCNESPRMQFSREEIASFSLLELLGARDIELVSSSIASLYFDTAPAKRKYYTGEELEVSDAIVGIKYENGTYDFVSIFDCEITGFNSSLTGDQYVTVTYEGFEIGFWVTVVDPATE